MVQIIQIHNQFADQALNTRKRKYSHSTSLKLSPADTDAAHFTNDNYLCKNLWLFEW